MKTELLNTFVVLVLLFSGFVYQVPQAYASSNGQQLIINVCGAQGLGIQGFNQNSQFVSASFSTNSSTCVWRITGWWWKSNVKVTAYYPGDLSESTEVYVPAVQTLSDWYTVKLTQYSTGLGYISRGQVWVNKNVKYNQKATAHSDGTAATNTTGYRTDCSGFISMAWGLSSQGLNVPNTVSLTGYAKTLSGKNDLLPGDIINNRKWDNDGHVLMFVSWVNKSAGTFIAYEERGSSGSVQTTRTLVQLSTGWGISEYPSAHNPWYLERKK